MEKKAVAYIGELEPKEVYEELARYAERAGLELEKAFFEEEGGSFKELINYCLKKGIRTVLIRDLSSLGRTFKELVSRYETLITKGFKVVRVREELKEVKDRELLEILKWVLKVQRRMIIYRTKKGLERARSLGKPIGRPRKPLPKEAVLELYNKGLSVSKIAALFDVSKATLYRRLKEWGVTRRQQSNV